MINHHNFNFTGGIPYAAGDRYFAGDMVRDFRFHQDRVGKVYSDLTGGQNVIMSGLEVTQGAGTTFNITAGTTVILYNITVPDSSGGWTVPSLTTTANIYMQTTVSALTNQAVAGWTAGGATNYLKLAYSETSQANRVRAKAAGSYDSESIPGYTLTCNTTAPTAYEIELTRFTEGGGTFTFDNTNRVVFSVKGNPLSVFIASTDSPAKVRGQADVIISTSANAAATINTYIDALTSAGGIIRLAEGTFNCTTAIVIKSNIVLQGNGYKTIIKKNVNTLQYLIATNETTYTDFILQDFTLDNNNSLTYTGAIMGINNLGAVTKDNATHLYKNIKCINGNATTTFTPFHYLSNMINCEVGATNSFTGTSLTCFNICYNLTNCKVSNITSLASLLIGFYNGESFVNCSCVDCSTTGSKYIYGFHSCGVMSVCRAQDLSSGSNVVYAFNGCYRLSSCIADTNASNSASAGTGFYNCETLVSCYSRANTNAGAGTGHGFSLCKHMTCNYGIANKTATYDTCKADYAATIAVGDTSPGGWNA